MRIFWGIIMLLASLFSLLQSFFITGLSGIGLGLSGYSGSMSRAAGFLGYGALGTLVFISAPLGFLSAVLVLANTMAGKVLSAISAILCIIPGLGGYTDALIYAVIYGIGFLVVQKKESRYAGQPNDKNQKEMEEVTPFTGSNGGQNGYLYNGTVYATREQAEAVRTEKLDVARLQDADQIQNALAPVAAFTAPDGTQAGYIYDGVVYATKEQAEAVRDEKTILIVDGVRYATLKQADEARDRLARTVDGVVYATHEQAERASRMAGGVEYATREQAEHIRFATREIDKVLYDSNINQMLASHPDTLYCRNIQKKFVLNVEDLFSVADEKLLLKTKNKVEKYITEQKSPQPLAKYFLGEIEKRIVALSVPNITKQGEEKDDANEISINTQVVTSKEELTDFVIKQVTSDKTDRTSEHDKERQKVNGDGFEGAKKLSERKLQQTTKKIVILVAFCLIAGVCYYAWQQKEKAYKVKQSLPSQSPSGVVQNNSTTQKRTNDASVQAKLPTEPFAPSIDWSSPHAQGYNHTSSDDPFSSVFSSQAPSHGLVPNKRVDILEQRRNHGGYLFYKVQYTENGSTVVGWIRADLMKVLPTGRGILDTTLAASEQDYSPQSSNEGEGVQATALPKLTGERPLTKASARKGYVTALGLNVRADHDNTSSVIAQAEQGASVSIIDTWQGPDSAYPWHKIDDLPDKYGWVYGKYIRFGDASSVEWTLSDSEYHEFMTYSDYAEAERQLTAAWNAIKQKTSGERYQQLLAGQNNWIEGRRNRMAKRVYEQTGGSKRECYLRATLQRVDELKKALTGGGSASYAGTYGHSSSTVRRGNGVEQGGTLEVKLLDAGRNLYEVGIQMVQYAYDPDMNAPMRMPDWFEGRGVIQNGSGVIAGRGASGDDIRLKLVFNGRNVKVTPANAASDGYCLTRSNPWTFKKEK